MRENPKASFAGTTTGQRSAVEGVCLGGGSKQLEIATKTITLTIK